MLPARYDDDDDDNNPQTIITRETADTKRSIVSWCNFIREI